MGNVAGRLIGWAGVTATLFWLVQRPVAQSIAQATSPGKPASKRAKLPEPGELSNRLSEWFFTDAFADGLGGARPAEILGALRQGVDPRPTQPQPAEATADNRPSKQAFRWSDRITAEVVEDEVKMIAQRIERELASPTEFKGRGYRTVRTDLAIAAALFAIVDRFEEPVRWKRSAAQIAPLLAATATRMKVGTDENLLAARRSAEQLGELIRGGSIRGPADRTWEQDWSKVVDRAALMKRLQQALDHVIQPAVSTPQRLNAVRADLVHESELVAALAATLIQTGMEDSDDGEYRQLATDLEKAARKLTVAAREADYETARSWASQTRKSCVTCHELYRG